jgi:hypothetical protein
MTHDLPVAPIECVVCRDSHISFPFFLSSFYEYHARMTHDLPVAPVEDVVCREHHLPVLQGFLAGHL